MPSTPDLGEFDSAYPYLISTLVPIGLRGFILASLCSAIISTIASLQNSSGHDPQRRHLPAVSVPGTHPDSDDALCPRDRHIDTHPGGCLGPCGHILPRDFPLLPGLLGSLCSAHRRGFPGRRVVEESQSGRSPLDPVAVSAHGWTGLSSQASAGQCEHSEPGRSEHGAGSPGHGGRNHAHPVAGSNARRQTRSGRETCCGCRPGNGRSRPAFFVTMSSGGQ